MFLIDSDGAALSAPTPAAVGGVVGYFQEGNPGLGVLATQVSADWLNMVQAEIGSVLTAAGVAYNKATPGQLAAAIKTMGKFTHTVSAGSPLSTWTINHNRNDANHIVQIEDTSGVVISDVTSITKGADTDTIVFDTAQAGKAILLF